MFYSVLRLLSLYARLFIFALWSPAWKELTSWLSFTVSNYKFVIFQLVSWVRCGTCLYRFLIFALLLTLHNLKYRLDIFQTYKCCFTFLCPQRNFGRHIVIALSVRQSVRPSRFRVRSISPIFFEVGIPNLVCGYILGWWTVAYHFWVTVTLNLTSDLVFKIIVSGAYLLYYLR